MIHELAAGLAEEEVCGDGDLGVPKALVRDLRLDSAHDSAYASIPSLNEATPDALRELSGGKLVRFRCMVQDTLEPEYFSSVYLETDPKTATTVLRTMKYHEFPVPVSAESSLDFPDNNDLPVERGVLNCITIPGEQSWVHCLDLVTSSGSSSCARGDDSMSARLAPQDKRFECIVKTYPIQSDSESCSVWGKLTTQIDHLRVGDTVEFIGILWADLADQDEEHMCVPEHHNPDDDLEAEQTCMEGDDDSKIETHETKSSHVIAGQEISNLRLHAITYRIVDHSESAAKSQSNEPSVVHFAIPESILDSATSQGAAIQEAYGFKFTALLQERTVDSNPLVPLSTESMENALLDMLEWATYGDKVAARFIFLSLFSRVYDRKAGRCMGRLNIALSHLAEGLKGNTLGIDAKKIVSRLEHVLGQLSPMCVPLAVNIPTLNECRWGPVRLPDEDRLRTAPLQVAPGTRLLLNELDMGQGTLESNGVQNVKVLGKLLTNSTLTYDFVYSEHDLPLDVSVVAVADSNAFLPTDVNVAYVLGAVKPQWTDDSPSPQIATRDGRVLPPALSLGVLRKYIAIARVGSFDMTGDESKMVQDKIVELLQNRERRAVYTEEHFHMRLTLARLLALARGHRTLDASIWDDVNDLAEQLLTRQEMPYVARKSGSGL